MAKTKLLKNLLAQIREAKALRAGMRVGIAVSGGADSVALWLLLTELRAELGLVVSAVHFNHKLRGKASDGDERFVAKLAEKLGVTLHVGRGDVAGTARRDKANLEDAARRARYAFFSRLTEQGVIDTVATAHTMDDQAETVLAHVIRGTGIAGLAGIHPVAGCVVRPLLGVRRAELRDYLRAKKQAWREDATNRDLSKNRARMRKKLLPVLKQQFNPAVVEHLAALAERALEQASFLEELASRVFQKHVKLNPDSAEIAIGKLRDPLQMGASESQSVLRARLILTMIERVKQRQGQILADHLEMVWKLAESGEPGKRVQLPGGVDAVKRRDLLVFEKRL
jgi:tRNA(Ile)-lysidine synthase